MNKRYNLILSIFIILYSSYSHSANRFWVANATSNWNNTANWSASSGGAGGASVPLAGDFVYFNANGTGNCDIDVVANFDGINTTAYTGIIDLNGFIFNPSSTGTANCTFENGTFNDTPGTQTLSFTTTGVIRFSGANFNIPIDVIGGRVAFDGGVFNSPVIIEDNGGANINGQGGCTFNNTFKVTNSGASYFLMGFANPDIFNGTATLLNTSTGVIRLGYNSIGTQFNDDIILGNTGGGIRFGEVVGATSILATTKTISIDPMGFDSGELRLRGFSQLGATPQAFSLTGTTLLSFAQNCIFNGAVNFDSPRIILDGVTFNSTSNLEKTGAGNDYGAGGNVFVGNCILKNSGTSNFSLGNVNSDDFQSNLVLNNTSTANIMIAGNSVGNTIAGDLSVTNNPTGTSGHVHISSNIASTLTVTGTTTLSNIGSSSGGNIYVAIGGDVTFNNNVVLSNSPIGTGGIIYFSHGANGTVTVNGNLTATNSGPGITKRIYVGNQGDLTVNGILTLTNSSSATNSNIYCNYLGTGMYNDDIVVESTNAASDGIIFGLGGGSGTLAVTKTVTIGGAGYISGNLEFRNFTQLGVTPQTLVPTGTTILNSRSSTWNGNVDFRSPNIYTTGSTYNGTAHLEKTGGNSGDYSNGGNLFVGNVDLVNSGSQIFYMGGNLPDVCQANLNLLNTGTHGIHYAASSVGNTIAGDLLMSNTGSGVSTRISVSGAAISTTNITGNVSSINNSTSTTSRMYLGDNGTISIGGNLTVSNTGIGTDLTYLGRSNSFSVTGTTTITNFGNSSHNVNIAETASSSATFNNNVSISNSGTGTLCRVFLGNQGDITINGVLGINNSSSATNSQVYCNYSPNSTGVYNENITVESTNVNSDGVSFGRNGGVGTLAATKTITISAGGFIAGDLLFRNFTQVGPTDHTLLATGVARIYNRDSDWGGNVDFRAPRMYSRETTYNQTTHLEKTGAISDFCGGGNLFVGNAIIKNSGSAYFLLGGILPDVCQANLDLINTGTQDLIYAYNSVGNTVAGNVIMQNLGRRLSFSDRLGASASINGTCTATLTSGIFNNNIYIGNSGDVVIGNTLTVSNLSTNNGEIRLANGTSSEVTVNGNSDITNSGTGPVSRIYLGNNGDITFNGTLSISNSSNANNSQVYCNNDANSIGLYNENITVESTDANSDGINFGRNGGIGTLAATKTITISAGGFIAGDLLFRNFTQVGATDHTLLATGVARIYNRDSDWGGNVDFRAPRMYSRETTYNLSSHLEKTGAISDWSEGGNLFVGNTVMKNSGSSYFSTGGTLPDICQANLDLINTGSHNIYYANNSAGNTIAGNVFISNTAIGAGTPSIVLSSGNLATVTVTGNCDVVNDATAVSSAIYVGNNGTVDITGNFTGLNQGTGNDYLYIGSNNTVNINSDMTITNSGTNNNYVYVSRNTNTMVTIGGNSVINNTSGGSLNRVYLGNSGNITFNGTLAINNSSSSTNSQVFCNHAASSIGLYNDNITLENTNASGDGVFFGNGNGIGTLAAGKTVSISAGGFIAGNLRFRNFTQLGGTSQTIHLTGTTIFENYNSVWNGNVDIESPRHYTRSTVYNANANLEKNGAGNDASFGGNTFNGVSEIRCTGTGYFMPANGTANDYNGDVTFIQTNSGRIYPAYNCEDTYAGDITVNSNGTAIRFGVAGNGRAIIDGTIAQSINNTGTTTNIEFRDIETQNPNAEITLNTPITVLAELDLQQGNLISSTANLIYMNNNSIVSSVSDAAFVDGPLEKIGNDSFIFPVGKGGFYRAIQMSNPSNNSARFRAEYFLTDPHPTYDETSKDLTIQHISSCEYWTLDRIVSSNNVSVSLTWNNATSCGVDQLSELLVARWDGTQWKDEGNGGTTGTVASGSVISSGVISSFSPFTLASTTINNPLPIELVHFSVEKNLDQSIISWETASEINNDYFEIERSKNNLTYESINKQKGAGNSSQAIKYSTIDDSPFNGINYYRLKQIDFDGTITYSEVKTLNFELLNDIAIYPNPVHQSQAFSISNLKGINRIIIYNELGKTVLNHQIENNSINSFSTKNLSNGLYMVKIIGDKQTNIKKLIIN